MNLRGYIIKLKAKRWFYYQMVFLLDGVLARWCSYKVLRSVNLSSQHLTLARATISQLTYDMKKQSKAIYEQIGCPGGVSKQDVTAKLSQHMVNKDIIRMIIGIEIMLILNLVQVLEVMVVQLLEIIVWILGEQRGIQSE